MSYRAWLSKFRFWGRSQKISSRRRAYRPCLETLEERAQPSVTPIHLYDLNGSLTDTLGGPSLAADGGTLTATRYVFGPNQGLRLTGGLADTTNYSIAFLCNLNTATSFFKKIVDFQNRTGDPGLYVVGSRLQLYPGGSGFNNVPANSDFHVTITRESATGLTRIYFNGVLDVTYSGSVSNAAISANNILSFFEDDLGTRTEAVAGSVDYIAIFNRPLTAAEVADLSGHPPTVTPTVSANQNGVSVNEGQFAINSGAWTNAASLSASVGVVTQFTNGTWNWSFATSDGPNETQTVTITAIGLNGGTALTTFQLNVNNVAPTITISGAADVDEGADYTLNLSAIDPGRDTVSAWTIHWGDGAVDNLPGNATAASHVYRSRPSAFTISAEATDEDGTHAARNSVAVQVRNVAPSVNVSNATVTVDEGQAATINGTFGDVGNDAVTLVASVGAVVSDGNGDWTWSLLPVDGPDQSQMVTITATDEDGSSSVATFQLVVNNVAPVISVSSAAVTVEEGQFASIEGLYSDVGQDAVTLSASVGTVTSNGAGGWTWSFSATDGPSQSQLVTITATDDDGAVATAYFQLTVNNVAPAVSAVGTSVTVDEGQTATMSGAYSDAGQDTVSLTASIGTITSDGAGGWTWSFGAADDAQTQIVTVTATDADGASVSVTFHLTVNNAAPTISSLTSSNLSGQVSIAGAFADPGSLDSHSVLISWGDGSPDEVLVSVSELNDRFSGTHRYLRAGAFTITVTVIDSDGAAVSRSTTTVVSLSGVNLVDGVLHVIGSAGKDVIRIDRFRGHLPQHVLRVSVQKVGTGKTSRPTFYYFDLAAVKRIVISTGGGKDQIIIAKNVKIDATVFDADKRNSWHFGDYRHNN